MKVLEVFCGTKSFSKAAASLGIGTFTIDYNKRFNPNIVVDMLYFNIKILPKEWRRPDIL